MTDTGLAEVPPAKTERQLKLAMQLLLSSLWEFVLTDGRVENSYLDDGAVFWESGRASPAGTDFISSMAALGVVPEDRSPLAQAIQACVDGKTPTFRCELRLEQPDRSTRSHLVRGTVSRDSAGTARYFSGVSSDITELQRAGDAPSLQQCSATHTEGESRWRRLAETLPLLVFTAAADGTIEYLGKQAIEYTGRTEQDMLGAGWAESIHPDDLERTGKSWFAAIEQQHTHEVQHRIRRSDGEYRWFTTRAQPARDSAGRVFKWVGTCTDVTDLKQLEDALQRTKDRLELAVRSSNLSIFEFELADGTLENSRHTLINFWEQLGYDPTQVPTSFAEAAQLVLTPEGLAHVPAEMQAYLSGAIPRFEMEHQVRHRDGSLHWRLARGVALRNEDGISVRFIGSHVDITNSKRMEHKLRESEQRWRTLVETVPHLVFTTEPNGEVDHFSAQTLAFLGRPESELLGSAWTDAIHPEDREYIGREWAKSIELQLPHETHHRVRRWDGEYRWMTTRAIPLRDDAGRVLKWFGTSTDITNMKQLEAELRHAKELLELGIRGSNVAIFDFDMPDGRIETARQTMINVWETLGYDPATAPNQFGPGAMLAIHPDDIARVQQEIGSYLAGHSENFEAEYRVRHKDGSVLWRIARGTAFRDAAHKPIRFIGSFFDITDIKRVGDQLRESEERWRTLAETLPQLVWSATADGGADYLSAQCQRFCGRAEAELVGEGWLDVIHPDDRAATAEAWSTAVLTEGLYNVDYRIRRADGVYRWFTVRGAPLRDRSGRAYKWVGACTDIEDGKQLAEKLRASEQAWQQLAEMVPHFVWTALADGSVDYYSAQATAYTGLPESELHGSRWAQTLHPEDREYTVKAWLEALGHQQPHNVEHRVRRHDGTYQWFSTRAVPILDHAGRTVRWFGTNTNIEGFKRLEAELRHARDLLVLGVRGSKVSIFEFDMPDGKIENSRKTWINLWESLGYDPAKAPPDFSSGSALAVHPDDLERVYAEIHSYLSGGREDFETEYRVRRKDGSVLWHLTRGVAFRDSNGRALRFIGSSVDITDKKHVEQQLRGSEQRWRSHAESLPQFVFTTTPDGVADYFSATTSAYTGFSQSELVGWAWGAAIHPDDLEHTTRTWLDNCANQRPHQVEHRIRRADGVYRWFTTRAAAVWDDEGKIVAWFGTCTDIENLKQLEVELRHTRDLLELAVRGSKVSVFDFDMPDGEIENAQQTMINLWESLGHDPLTAPTRFNPGAELAVHPDDIARVRAEIQAYLYGTRQDFEIEFRVRHKDGTVIWHLARGLAYRDPEGKPVRFIGTFVDITDKKEVEGQHRESEQRWRTLSEALPLLVWSANAQGVPDYFSAQTVEFTGVSMAELCGDGWLNSVHPDDRAHGSEVWLKALATQSLYQVDFRIRRADGEYRWFTSRARPVLDSVGHVSRWFGTCMDIEEGKRLAEELRSSQQRWQTLAEMVPHFVWSASADGMVDYYSAQATAYTGLPESELRGIRWAQTLHPEDRDFTVKAWLDAVAQRRPHNVEHRVRKHDGSYQWLSTRAVPILDAAGNTVLWVGTNTNVEDFKRLEAELRHARDLLELGVRGSKVAIFDFDMPDGTLENAKQTMINLWESLGYDPASAPGDFGTGARLAVHPDDLERVRGEAELYLNGNRDDFEVEFRVRHKDGSVLWYLSRGVAYRDPDGKPLRFIGSFVDITDKKQVEERHRQSEQRWQTLTETLPQLVWSANADGAGEYFSTQAEKFIGVPEAELIGAGWLNAVHPDDRAHTVDVWLEALRTESLYEVDFRIRRSDGVYRWFTTRAQPLRDGSGRVFRWVGTCTDIEGGKQLAEKLRASEERWRSHAESLPQFVFTMTPDGQADYFSATTSAYTGLSQSQLLGWGWGAAVHPDDRDRTIATWLDNLSKRRGHEVEHRIRRADGAYRWFTTRAAAVLDGSGEIVAWFGTCTDIEDLKQLEADLRQAKERLELAIRSANLCIWEYDMPHGTLENSRETLTNVWESFGYDALDAPPSVAAVMHPDDIPRVSERIMACLNGDTPAFEAEHRVRYKDGSYHWLLGRGVTLRDAEGRPTRFVGTSVDINDIKRIEADLLRAREAAESANRAKDEFLANVSHEIRTPMNAILGMTELALDSARTEHQRQLLSTVRTAARNLLNIINDLLDSRRSPRVSWPSMKPISRCAARSATRCARSHRAHTARGWNSFPGSTQMCPISSSETRDACVKC